MDVGSIDNALSLGDVLSVPKARNRPGKEGNRFRMMKPTFRAMVRAIVGDVY